jgi:enamine deaminase RidA (YjgF/YER057c/UK114 family)
VSEIMRFLLPGGIEAKTRQVIAKRKSVLAGCGAAWERTVMARIHLREFDRDSHDGAIRMAKLQGGAFGRVSQAEALIAALP